jgi:hypothetical protein
MLSATIVQLCLKFMITITDSALTDIRKDLSLKEIFESLVSLYHQKEVYGCFSAIIVLLLSAGGKVFGSKYFDSYQS